MVTSAERTMSESPGWILAEDPRVHTSQMYPMNTGRQMATKLVVEPLWAEA